MESGALTRQDATFQTISYDTSSVFSAFTRDTQAKSMININGNAAAIEIICSGLRASFNQKTRCHQGLHDTDRVQLDDRQLKENIIKAIAFIAGIRM